MSSSENVWRVWRLSKATGKSPADCIYIPKSDQLARWSFDSAVSLFGESLEAELEKASSDAKNEKEAKRKQDRILKKWLPEAMNAGGGPKFADPARKEV